MFSLPEPAKGFLGEKTQRSKIHPQAKDSGTGEWGCWAWRGEDRKEGRMDRPTQA